MGGRIQGPSATFPKEEMVAYGKKLRSSGLAGTSRHRDTVDLGPEAGAIADGLLRAPSTVMREMQRNGWRTQSERGPQRVAGGYRSLPAQRRAQRLATKPRVPRKLIVGTPLWSQVVDALHQGLSPAQIARTLARMPDPVRLSSETIYNTLYAMPRGELRSRLLALMRRRHHARRAQRGTQGPRKP